MKIGLLAYSTNTGLGYLTRDFYKHIKVDKVLIADLSSFNKMEVNHDWVDEKRISKGIPSNEDVEWLVDDMDLVFIAETPLNYHLFEYAKQKGVKTILQYMFEFLSYFNNKQLPIPDVLASPSYWKMNEVKELNLARVEYLPVPVDCSKIPHRKAGTVSNIIHIMGRMAKNDRNGTLQFLELARRDEFERFNFIMYGQSPKEDGTKVEFERMMKEFEKTKAICGKRLELILDIEDNRELFSKGELMIFPRKYAGLSLPLWEALCAGMPVIMTDISPNNKVLPSEWLCEAYFEANSGLANNIDMYKADINSLVDKSIGVIDEMEKHNMVARRLAEDMSWEKRKKDYLKLFEDICG